MEERRRARGSHGYDRDGCTRYPHAAPRNLGDILDNLRNLWSLAQAPPLPTSLEICRLQHSLPLQSRSFYSQTLKDQCTVVAAPKSLEFVHKNYGIGQCLGSAATKTLCGLHVGTRLAGSTSSLREL